MARRADPPGYPNVWKLVGWLVSGLLGILLMVGSWYSSSLNTAVAQVKTEITQEKTDRLEQQRKTDVSVQEIKGKIEQIQRDVERIERGQTQTQEKIDKVLEELRKSGRVR